MNKKHGVRKYRFLLLEIVFAMTLFLSMLPFIFKQFSLQRLKLEKVIVDLQLHRIQEESLFLVEQDIKSTLLKNSFLLEKVQSSLELCPQKIITSQGKLIDIFYNYKINKYEQCEKNDKKAALVNITLTLFLPKKKQVFIERSLFFSYEEN